MDIRALKAAIRKELIMMVGASGTAANADLIKDRVSRGVENRLYQTREAINDTAKNKIITDLCNDFLRLGPLEPLMADPTITEIMVNGPSVIFFEKNGKKIKSTAVFDDEAHLRYIMEKMITPTGRRIDESSPFVDFALKDGSRVNFIIAPLAVGGPIVTIRKFLRSIRIVEDLEHLGTIDRRMAEFLVACIRARMNIMFSGATGSGKTTSLDVLSYYIAPEDRVIVIEDTLELTLQQEHIVRLLTKPSNIEGKGEITIRDLFSNCLRMRPTRIILGEIRGAEAMDYLQSLNSGHNGSLAVIHASRPSDAISRLETMALYAGLYMSVADIRRKIASGLNIIIQQEMLPDGVRKVTHIAGVRGFKEGELVLYDIFRYEQNGIDKNGKVEGKFVALGKPHFFDMFNRRGVNLNVNIFTPDTDSEEKNEFKFVT